MSLLQISTPSDRSNMLSPLPACLSEHLDQLASLINNLNVVAVFVSHIQASHGVEIHIAWLDKFAIKRVFTEAHHIYSRSRKREDHLDSV